MKMQNICKDFRLCDQFKGSSGSAEGVGTRMMSLRRASWDVWSVPSKSTRCVVPGTTEVSTSWWTVAIVE